MSILRHARYVRDGVKVKEQVIAYRASNPERVQAWEDARDPEKYRVRSAAYYQANRAAVRARQNARNKEHPERRRAKDARFYKSHPEHFTVNRQQRRANLAKVESTLTGDEVELALEVSCGLCAYCLKPYGDKPTVDHVAPISKGGPNVAENIVIACKSCNSSKGVRGILCMANVGCGAVVMGR